MITPTVGYDPSWVTALNWATARGLDYGTEIIYTSGPLGFSERPQAVFGAAIALYGALWLLVSNLGLGIALLWAARRRFPLPVAFAVAAVVAVLAIDATLAIAFLICAVAVTDPEDRPRRTLLVLGPALAAIGLLTKLNEGVAIALMVSIALLTLEWGRPRRLLAAAAVFLAVFFCGWFATGQGLGNLDDYAGSSLEIVSGYSTGLAAEHALVSWTRWAGAVLLAAVIAATVVMSRGLPNARRAALIGVTLVLCFASAKHGFVRNDAPHTLSFVSAMLLPWLVLPWAGRQRLVPIAAVAAITLVSIPMLGSDISESRWKLTARISQSSDLLTLVLPNRRAAVEERAREQLHVFYSLPPRQLRQLEGGTVHVEPWEVSLIWAYGLDWDPLPVFDATAAYLPSLDDRRAEDLRGEGAPELIVRQRSPDFLGGFFPANYSIDGHYGPWNSPAAALEMFCRYAPISTSERYQVLARFPDRCGEPKSLGKVSTTYGGAVPVPVRGREKGAILAKVTGLGPTLLEEVKTLLYRADPRAITLDGGVTRVPLVAENARSGLIVWIAPALDFPAPFGMAPDAQQIRFDEFSRLNDGSGEIEVEFVLVPAKPLPHQRAPR